MKKIFTLLASALVASSAMAQGVALDANRIATFYRPYDGEAFNNVNHFGFYKTAKTNGVTNITGVLPIANPGDYANNVNHITLTQDYTDSDTGFSVPAGEYTTMCNNTSDGNSALCFYCGSGTSTHISNIKKFIVYCAGIGASKSTSGSLFKDGIRINGTKIYTGPNESDVLTNPVAGTEATTNWLTRYVWTGVISQTAPSVYDPATTAITENTFTQDKLFRIVIDLKNPHNPDDAIGGKDHEGAADENVVSANVGDGSYELKTDHGCLDTKTGLATCNERVYNVCHKFVDPDGDGAGTGASNVPGYRSYDWTWSKDMGFALQIKKCFNVFAIAFICGDDNAKTYAVDMNQFTARNQETVWTEVGISPTAIQSVNAAAQSVAPAKSIENGRVVISKNGHKYTAAGAMLK